MNVHHHHVLSHVLTLRVVSCAHVILDIHCIVMEAPALVCKMYSYMCVGIFSSVEYFELCLCGCSVALIQTSHALRFCTVQHHKYIYFIR